MKSKGNSWIYIILLIICCNIQSINAQSKSTRVVIEGMISSDYKPKQIELFHIQSGVATPLITSEVSENGVFAIEIEDLPYEGFYRLSQYYNAAVLYLKPGKKIKIKLLSEGYNILSRDKENEILEKWSSICNLVNRNRRKTANPAPEIWADLDSIVQLKNNFFAQSVSKNKKFDYAFRVFANAQFNYELCNLTQTPPNNKPAVSSYPSIYKELGTGKDFVDSRILNYDFGQHYLNTYLQFVRVLEMNQGNRAISNISLLEKYVSSDTLKGIVLVNQLRRAMTYDDSFEQSIQQIQKYLLTDKLKADFDQIVHNVKTISKGRPATNFGGEDIHGFHKSLLDFKGKVVVVDLWATWCVPCRQEIPHLQKLEKEFHGQDVIFLSVATSDTKDKWQKMVQDDQMTGVQLFADKASEKVFNEVYKVSGIPRFMVFDKVGNIVSIDAPRPSNPSLKSLISTLL